LELVPAFVIEPDGRAPVVTAQLYKGEIDPSIGRMRGPAPAGGGARPNQTSAR
jgi:hypothetical protein